MVFLSHRGDRSGSLLWRRHHRKTHLEDQLRQSTKMESVGQLAGGIAHDFNNILTAVLGYVEFLQNLPEIGEDGLTACREMEASVRRAADLTKQLLLYSKKRVATRMVLI